MELLSVFHFMRPYWLLLLVPFGLLVLLQWRKEDQLSRWRKLLPPHLLKALTLGQQGWRSNLPLKVLAMAFALGMVIAAGPTWQRQASPFGEDKAPLIVVLDLSESMEQGDLPPSRLERAKQKIADLIEQRGGGQTALVLFSGSAHIAMPLTQDNAIFLPLLHASQSKIMPRSGKFAERSLPLVDRLMADQTAPATVLLVSDGIGANTTERFSEYFASSRHQLLILAVGIEDSRGALATDWSGLERLADAANGEQIALSFDNSDIEWLNGRIERHMLLNGDSVMPWQDMGYLLLFPLILSFSLWFRRGWTVQWAWLLLAVGLAGAPTPASAEWRFADLWLTTDQQGQWLQQQQRYAEAAERYQDPMRKAVAYYLAEDFASAHSYFLRVDSEQALFNGAMALAQQREYVAARNLLDLLLEQSPEFTHAQHNRDTLQALIDEINRMSESQANNEMQASRELGEQPQTGDGADEKVARELMLEEKISADVLLQDPAINEKWMRRVEADPAQFLATKFAIELDTEPKPGAAQ